MKEYLIFLKTVHYFPSILRTFFIPRRMKFFLGGRVVGLGLRLWFDREIELVLELELDIGTGLGTLNLRTIPVGWSSQSAGVCDWIAVEMDPTSGASEVTKPVLCSRLFSVLADLK